MHQKCVYKHTNAPFISSLPISIVCSLRHSNLCHSHINKSSGILGNSAKVFFFLFHKIKLLAV